MDTNKATNIYERMVIEIYNNYLKEVADEDTLKEIKEDISYDLIDSEIKDVEQMERSVRFYLEEYAYTKMYMELIKYRKDNDMEKHKEYAYFIGRQLNKEMDIISQYQAPAPMSVNVLYPTKSKAVDDLFTKAIYDKVQQMIKEGYNFLEFKVEDKDEVYVLLISGEFAR